MARQPWLLVAKVASESDPGHEWPVKTEGTRLGCGCPRWVFARKDAKDCRHVREVEGRIAGLGGIRVVYNLLRRGIDLNLGGAAPTAVPPGRRHPSPAPRPRRQAVQPPPPTTTDAILAAQPDWLGGGRAIILRD